MLERALVVRPKRCCELKHVQLERRLAASVRLCDVFVLASLSLTLAPRADEEFDTKGHATAVNGLYVGSHRAAENDVWRAQANIGTRRSRELALTRASLSHPVAVS